MSAKIIDVSVLLTLALQSILQSIVRHRLRVVFACALFLLGYDHAHAPLPIP